MVDPAGCHSSAAPSMGGVSLRHVVTPGLGHLALGPWRDLGARSEGVVGGDGVSEDPAASIGDSLSLADLMGQGTTEGRRRLSDTPTGLRRLAKGGRRPGFEGEITVFDGGAHAPYDRPNLSKDYLAGNAPEEWIPLHPRAYYRCASGRRRAHSCRASASIRRSRGGDQAPSPAESVPEAGLAQHRLAARALRRPRGSEASPSMRTWREAPTEAPGSRSPAVVTHHEQGLLGSDVVAGYHPRDLGQGKRLGQLVSGSRQCNQAAHGFFIMDRRRGTMPS
jgi:hypothetical protein